MTSSQRQLTWVDRSGTARGTVGDPDATLNHPNVSPDGRRVVVSRIVQGNFRPLAAGRCPREPVHV